MLTLETKILFAFMILLVVAMIILLIVNIRRHKSVTKLLTPTRFLNKSDLQAINFLEIEGNLSVNLLLRPKLPKKKIFKSIWRFTDITFQIKSVYKYKRVVHHFFLGIGDKLIEIIIPEIFLPYLYEGTYYKGKTIEILYRMDHFVLYDIEGVIGYPSLFEKFQLESGIISQSTTKRRPSKEELEAFILSKWSSTWGLMPPVIFPIFILGVMDEGMGLSIVFLPFVLIIIIPLYLSLKKRKKYIADRMVHKLEGTIWYDDERYVYRINEDELKLHPKWQKVIKRNGVPIENVQMEALLHTYDNLDLKVCRKFQPIAMSSVQLHLNEDMLKSTRGYLIPMLYLIASAIIAINAPGYENSGNIIIDPRELWNIRENYFFALLMTIIWWASIVASIYLTYLVAIRIWGYHFTKENYRN